MENSRLLNTATNHGVNRTFTSTSCELVNLLNTDRTFTDVPFTRAPFFIDVYLTDCQSCVRGGDCIENRKRITPEREDMNLNNGINLREVRK